MGVFVVEHQKISKEILKVNRFLSIKFHVNLDSSYTSYNQQTTIPLISEYTNASNQKSLNINNTGFMTFELRIPGIDWSKDQSIMVFETMLYRVIKGFGVMKKYLYEGEMFAINKQDEITLYSDKAKEKSVLINVSNGQRIYLSPAVIKDDNDLTYEGVIMYINNTANLVELPIDEFESICHLLSKIDYFLYSQSLINMYINYYPNKEVYEEYKLETKKKTKPKANIFNNLVVTSTPEPSGTLVKDDDTFEGLEEEKE